ncbi:MAG: HNH endonuclease, partial [Holdemanella sp.]|nr:HNH endonuclease [Holdemanella sp.]
EKDCFLPTIIRLLYIQKELKVEGIHEWLNMDMEIADIEYKEYIQRMFPIKGIPKDRNITKNLQTFFKDMLMHEFDHSCPICKINMEYMLIASHIRPFRDCSHIYEAFDNNNGLLLCKNHDALFDEGYISFDEEGKIILSPYLEHEERYQLNKVILPKKYQTKNRMAYIAYHRNYIFQK